MDHNGFAVVLLRVCTGFVADTSALGNMCREKKLALITSSRQSDLKLSLTTENVT